MSFEETLKESVELSKKFIEDQKVSSEKETKWLRDHFAGLAMQGHIASDKDLNFDAVDIAMWSYEQADAMLKEREKINETEYQNDIQAAFGGLSQTAAEY